MAKIFKQVAICLLLGNVMSLGSLFVSASDTPNPTNNYKDNGGATNLNAETCLASIAIDPGTQPHINKPDAHIP